MKPWIRANAHHVILMIALIGTVSGWVTSAHYRGVAEAEAASNARLTEERDAARTIADAARQASDRAVAETKRQRERDSTTIANLNRTLDGLEDVNSGLQAAAEAELAAHDDWVRGETYRSVVASYDRTLIVMDSLRLVERAGRLQEAETVGRLEVTLSTLTADRDALEAVVEGKDRQIAALENASGSSLFSLDLDAGLWGALGVGVGYLIGSAR
jgi:hypothetical protein